MISFKLGVMLGMPILYSGIEATKMFQMVDYAREVTVSKSFTLALWGIWFAWAFALLVVYVTLATFQEVTFLLQIVVPDEEGYKKNGGEWAS